MEVEIKDKGVQSVERVLDIIEALATEESGLGVTEVAERTGLHKSTAYRLLATLVSRGYAKKRDDGTYRIGLKMIEAVSCHINSLELQTEARPYLGQIAANLGLTAHLAVLDGDKVVYIEKLDVFAVRMYAQIGMRMHAYCSSLGKCLLSNFSRDELEERMKDCGFQKFTENTITTMDGLWQEMNKVRSQGYAVDNEEFEIGHRCTAAPIYDYKGDIIAAISASGPSSVLTPEKLPEAADYVMKTAREVSESMGYIL